MASISKSSTVKTRRQKRTAKKNARKRALRRAYYKSCAECPVETPSTTDEEENKARRLQWEKRNEELKEEFEGKQMLKEDMISRYMNREKSAPSNKDSASLPRAGLLEPVATGPKQQTEKSKGAGRLSSPQKSVGPVPPHVNFRAPSKYDTPHPPGPDVCPFFWRTGACKYSLDCSRTHPFCPISAALVFPNMFQAPAVTIVAGEDLDNELEVTEKEVQDAFEEFYEDTYSEFQQFGKVLQFYVCKNTCAHLKGNVYIEYDSKDASSKALLAMQTRWYAGNQVYCRFVAIPSWREAVCDLYRRNRCSRKGLCNFLHPFYLTRRGGSWRCEHNRQIQKGHHERKNTDHGASVYERKQQRQSPHFRTRSPCHLRYRRRPSPTGYCESEQAGRSAPEYGRHLPGRSRQTPSSSPDHYRRRRFLRRRDKKIDPHCVSASVNDCSKRRKRPSRSCSPHDSNHQRKRTRRGERKKKHQQRKKTAKRERKNHAKKRERNDRGKSRRRSPSPLLHNKVESEDRWTGEYRSSSSSSISDDGRLEEILHDANPKENKISVISTGPAKVIAYNTSCNSSGRKQLLKKCGQMQLDKSVGGLEKQSVRLPSPSDKRVVSENCNNTDKEKELRLLALASLKNTKHKLKTT